MIRMSWENTATAQMLLRDALSWFDSHEVEEKLGHLPQWVNMARRLLEEDGGRRGK